MNKIFLYLFLLIWENSLSAQKSYFQQEVNYTINVSLNDVTHELSAFEKIQYINNSKSSLRIMLSSKI